jgi:tRNA threonylcarbamoyladenosine biosynthesis protein TsaE
MDGWGVSERDEDRSAEASQTGARSSATGGDQLALVSERVERTQRLGEMLGNLLRAGDIILLTGELGAGKTALTQGIGRGLGVRETVNSPTFTILKEYAGRVPLYHFDLYRIEDPAELEALGFEMYFGADGVAVVEWAERGEDADGDETVWPADYLRIQLRTTGEQGRLLECSAVGPRGAALLADFAFAMAEHGTREGEANA